MRHKNKQIIVVGDRVLIRPDEGERKSAAGLYLPPSVLERQEIRGGIIVEVGPGIPVSNPDDLGKEPWQQEGQKEIKYIPTQAVLGDYALFLNKAAIEVKFEQTNYLIVPQSAIMVLIRDDLSDLSQ
ncbi:MAG: co-chaperone GroES [Candidatus Marinimicrobia bacterium]|nr:co-chaperone GroES [Candidatus Neomarinimicrobiota bacterium]